MGSERHCLLPVLAYQPRELSHQSYPELLAFLLPLRRTQFGDRNQHEPGHKLPNLVAWEAHPQDVVREDLLYLQQPARPLRAQVRVNVWRKYSRLQSACNASQRPNERLH